jgi:hypothetical protein
VLLIEFVVTVWEAVVTNRTRLGCLLELVAAIIVGMALFAYLR